jgi:hypothetical protein
MLMNGHQSVTYVLPGRQLRGRREVRETAFLGILEPAIGLEPMTC